MTDDLASPATRLSTGSMISLGLVITLLLGGISYGRQTQRLESIDADLSRVRVELLETRREVREVRDLLLRLDPPR
jgi:hypothetical protein